MVRLNLHFADRVPPPEFHRYVAGARIASGRVMSLERVAAIMNDSQRYERSFSASDIARIEKSALQKIRRRLLHARPQPDHNG